MRIGFKMWKASWVILIGYIALFILDITSTLSVGNLVRYMETNPVFLITGWIGLILINVLAIYLLLKGYDIKKPYNRFMVITAFVYLSVVRIFVSINNFSIGKKVQSGEITKAMVEGVSDSVKATSYSWMIVLNIFAPLVFSMVIYYLFSLDHKIEIKNE